MDREGQISSNNMGTEEDNYIDLGDDPYKNKPSKPKNDVIGKGIKFKYSMHEYNDDAPPINNTIDPLFKEEKSEFQSLADENYVSIPSQNRRINPLHRSLPESKYAPKCEADAEDRESDEE